MYTPAAKIAYAVPLSEGRVKSDSSDTEMGTQVPIKIENPILASKIPSKSEQYEIAKVQPVQAKQAPIQSNFLE